MVEEVKEVIPHDNERRSPAEPDSGPGGTVELFEGRPRFDGVFRVDRETGDAAAGDREGDRDQLLVFRTESALRVVRPITPSHPSKRAGTSFFSRFWFFAHFSQFCRT